MSLLNNPKKKAHGIIKKIEQGNATESNINNLGEILGKEPSLVPEIVSGLTSILQRSNRQSFRLAIYALSVVADKDIDIISDSVDVISSFLQKDLQTGEILKTLEIMLKIYQGHPEKMNIAVPRLLACLRNMNPTVRENAYFLLASIAMPHPELFKGHTRELNLALNGLNTDERSYACKLIKKIAEKDPDIVKDTYEVLSDLKINHPSRELRIEAESVIKTLGIKKPERASEDMRISGGNITASHQGSQQKGPELSLAMEPENEELETFEQVTKNTGISARVKEIVQGTDIGPHVLKSVYNIALELSREGREGKPVGTSFIIGNSGDVLAMSKQLIHNPVESIPAEKRIITDPELSETIKELAQLDGAFVVSGTGVVEAACRFLTADASQVSIPQGLGTKHFSVAAMTMATKAIGIVVSESGGRITIFRDGKKLNSLF